MKVDKLVPDVYYKESRDFSYIGRLFEIVFNYMKTNADLIDQDLDSENTNSLLLELLKYTLGFESKHDYINKDVIHITSTFIDLLKKKGTREAIEEAILALLNSQKIEDTPYITLDNETYTITLYVPEALEDIILVEDLFEYILPTGWTYTIIKTTWLPDYNPSDRIVQTDSTNNHSSNKQNAGQIVKVEQGSTFVDESYTAEPRMDIYSAVIYTEGNNE